MTQTEQIITIAMVVLGTMLTRFLPFLAFPAGKPTPKYVQYLGKVLPQRGIWTSCRLLPENVSVFAGSHGLPEMISIGAVAALHLWKRQMLYPLRGNHLLHDFGAGRILNTETYRNKQGSDIKTGGMK